MVSTSEFDGFTRGMRSVMILINVIFKILNRDFPGGPVAKTPCSQCRGPGLDPWSGK